MRHIGPRVIVALTGRFDYVGVPRWEVGMTSLFANANAMRLFPSVVWRAEFTPDDHRRINGTILAKLAELRRDAPPLGLGESWQTHQSLQELDESGDMATRIDAAVKDLLRYLRIGHGVFHITGCWANVNAPGAGHGIHQHPNNFLSGVYYVRTPEDADTINFHDPRSQTSILRPPVVELTADNSDQVVVRVAAGTLLLFPSWLQHSVDANRGGEERVSVSFNVMLSRYAEGPSKPLW